MPARLCTTCSTVWARLSPPVHSNYERQRPTASGSGTFGKAVLSLGVLAVAVLTGVLAVQQIGMTRTVRALNIRLTGPAERVEELARADQAVEMPRPPTRRP